MSKSEEIVSIGDFLGVIEEFIPGSGTHEIDGKIYASFVGIKKIDRQKLEIKVEPLKKKDLPVPKPGDLVICEVALTRKQSALCHIFKLKNMFLFDTYTGVLHVSNMSQNYLNNVDDGFKPTDIVRAKVISKNFTEFELSTRGPELGVLYAECCNCGTALKRQGNGLICDLCGYPNPRKIANDYGRVRERIENLH
nr:exosome complex RNA-binding protein Csl4 [Candidatus Sigynarchaeota archaeon]